MILFDVATAAKRLIPVGFAKDPHQFIIEELCFTNTDHIVVIGIQEDLGGSLYRSGVDRIFLQVFTCIYLTFRIKYLYLAVAKTGLS